MFYKIEKANILQAILDQFKKSIANGELVKGDRLPSERKMSETFGVSRATIREAIKALELIGLVECAHGTGNYIAQSLDYSLVEPLSIMFNLEGGSIIQVLEIRRALETAAISLAVARITDHEMEELLEIYKTMYGEIDQNTAAGIDRNFHYKIASASRNPLIITMLNAISCLIENQINRARQEMLCNKENVDRINAQHHEIIESLRNKDSDLAIKAMNEHMNYIEEFIRTNN